MMPENRPQDQHIVIVDVGTGNIRSVDKALKSLGAISDVSSDPAQILTASKIVLPGVGAFGDFMDRLRQLNLVEPIITIVNKDVPILGICVGMQAFFKTSFEMGSHLGLGMLDGLVKCFPRQPGLKIPQTGWNQISFQSGSSLFRDLPANPYVFYNHAYYCEPNDSTFMVATSDYGIRYCAAVQRGNIFGVQFHPEKSQTIGLKILDNFIKL